MKVQRREEGMIVRELMEELSVFDPRLEVYLLAHPSATPKAQAISHVEDDEDPATGRTAVYVVEGEVD